jgi:hypothetical protein
MPHPNFAVKTNGRELKMRDGKTRQMKTLHPRLWVFFDDLCPGVACCDGPDVRMKAIGSEEEYAALIAENDRERSIIAGLAQTEEPASEPSERDTFIARHDEMDKQDVIARAEEMGLEFDGRLAKAKILGLVFDAIEAKKAQPED